MISQDDKDSLIFKNIKTLSILFSVVKRYFHEIWTMDISTS